MMNDHVVISHNKFESVSVDSLKKLSKLSMSNNALKAVPNTQVLRGKLILCGCQWGCLSGRAHAGGPGFKPQHLHFLCSGIFFFAPKNNIELRELRLNGNTIKSLPESLKSNGK